MWVDRKALPLRIIIRANRISSTPSLCIHVMNQFFIPLFQGLAGSSSISMLTTFQFVLLPGMYLFSSPNHIFFPSLILPFEPWILIFSFFFLYNPDTWHLTFWMQWLQNSHTSLWSKNSKTQRVVLTDASRSSWWWSWGEARKACPWRLSRCIQEI